MVVAHLGLLETRDPHRRQLLTDPGGICVYDLAKQEFCPDGQDLAVHRRVLLNFGGYGAPARARVHEVLHRACPGQYDGHPQG